jgi:hypothetical protein
MLAWWYVCIGWAFVMLGVRSLLSGDQVWSVAFRFVIAVGFVVLGMGTLRTTGPNGSIRS